MFYRQEFLLLFFCGFITVKMKETGSALTRLLLFP